MAKDDSSLGAGGAALAGNPSALNTYNANPSDIDSYNEALQNSVQALKDRYANPNWFNVAAGFAKPQLGGFTASLGSASQALGDWQEQQRAQQLPIAQMQQQLALNKITMGQNKSAADKLKGLVSGQTPINPVTVGDIVATSPGTPAAEAAKNLLPSIGTATANTVAAQNVLPVNGVTPDIAGAGTVPQPVQDAITRNKNADATGRKHNMQDDAIVAIGGTQTDTSNAANPAADNTAELHRVDEDLKAAKLERSKSTNMMQRASLDAAIDDLQNHRAKLTGSTQAPQQISPPVNQPAAQPVQQNSTLSPAQQSQQNIEYKKLQEASDMAEHVKNNTPMTDEKRAILQNKSNPAVGLMPEIGNLLSQPGMSAGLGILNSLPAGAAAMAGTMAKGTDAGINTPAGHLGLRLNMDSDSMLRAGITDPTVRANIATLSAKLATMRQVLGPTTAGEMLSAGLDSSLSRNAIQSLILSAGASAYGANDLNNAKQNYAQRTGDNTMAGFKASPERKKSIDVYNKYLSDAAELSSPIAKTKKP